MISANTGRDESKPFAVQSSKVRWSAMMAVAVLLLVMCALSVSVGTRSVGLADIFAALGGQIDNVAQAAVAARLPRTLLPFLLAQPLVWRVLSCKA